MSANRPEMLVKPWLFDAMSGDLQPPTDPENRIHTIGRLANAAAQKGDRSFDVHTRLGSIIGEQYTYRPSWSPSVAAIVNCNILGNTPVLSGIALRSDTSRLLSINNVEDGLVMFSGGKLLEIPAANERPDVAREAVTTAAAEFFRGVHQDMR